MKIYADNAATTAMSEAAIQAMLPYMRDNFGNPSSIHGLGQTAKVAIETAREEIAGLIGALSKEVYFTAGGTESDNQAIISAAYIGAKKGKKHIIASAFEHHAVLHTLDKLKDEGFEITLLDVHENGVVEAAQVESAIREDTALVTIIYVNNEIGTVQPIREIGAVCREKKVLFHTDAVQAVGHIPVDVNEDNIDLLSLSAHKFHGPKGIGILYARNGIVPVPVIEGGLQERGKRPGTENVPAIVGMAAALKEAMENLEVNADRIIPKRNRLIEGLNTIKGAFLNGDIKRRCPGMINYSFEGVSGEALVMMLDEKGIYVSAGSACASGSKKPSHAITALGKKDSLAGGSIRISIDENITDEEVDYVISSIRDCVYKLRK